MWAYRHNGASRPRRTRRRAAGRAETASRAGPACRRSRGDSDAHGERRGDGVPERAGAQAPSPPGTQNAAASHRGAQTVKPNVIYVDGDKRYKGVKADIDKALELFPDATLAGSVRAPARWAAPRTARPTRRVLGAAGLRPQGGAARGGRGGEEARAGCLRGGRQVLGVLPAERANLKRLSPLPL
eukprot:COSAG04_NODE_7507_length_1116_cov_1.832842_1_plen_184_part_10